VVVKNFILTLYDGVITSSYNGKMKRYYRQVGCLLWNVDDDNFYFQELQYSRLAPFVRLHLEQLSKEREEKIESARTNKTFRVCDCCGNDECLDEDMLPWSVRIPLTIVIWNLLLLIKQKFYQNLPLATYLWIMRQSTIYSQSCVSPVL
jgi:hypothetical protein